MHQRSLNKEELSFLCLHRLLPVTDEIVVVVLIAVVCHEVMLLHHAIAQQSCKSFMYFPLAVM